MPEQASLRESVAAGVAATTKIMSEHSGIGLADIQTASATFHSATAMALLYVGDQIREQIAVQREQVEQQKLTNALMAGQFDACDSKDEAALAAYVYARIGDIVNTESDTDQ